MNKVLISRKSNGYTEVASCLGAYLLEKGYSMPSHEPHVDSVRIDLEAHCFRFTGLSSFKKDGETFYVRSWYRKFDRYPDNCTDKELDTIDGLPDFVISGHYSETENRVYFSGKKAIRSTIRYRWYLKLSDMPNAEESAYIDKYIPVLIGS